MEHRKHRHARSVFSAENIVPNPRKMVTRMTFPQDWPPPSFVQTNGITLAVHEAGPREARPPIVLCHGFPELAYSWRWQLSGLAARGIHALAPDQRGYGLSDAPDEVEAYRSEELCRDLIGLLDARNIEKAVFAGHDWGGFVVWELALRHPERVAGVIGVNTPFIKRPACDPLISFRRRFGDDMYILWFQTPEEPERLMEGDLDKTFRFFMRAVRPLIGERPNLALHDVDAEPLVQAGPGMRDSLLRYDPPADPRPLLLSDQDLSVYSAAYRRSGFRGPINWYRNWSVNWERSAHLPQYVDAPSLIIMAEHDLVLPPSGADGMEEFVPNLEKYLVRGAGHWTQQEKPDEVTAVIADWMERTFG